MTLRKPLDVIENLLPHIGILIFDRSVDVLLVAVHHRLFPVHPGLRKNIKRAPQVRIIERRCRLAVPSRE